MYGLILISCPALSYWWLLCLVRLVLAELPSLQGVYGFKVDANLELTDSNIEYYSLIEP